MSVDLSNWRLSEINTDSLWLIGSRDKSGKHSNVYHGNFVPQVPRQLISRYTNPGDLVVDLFMGSGTTLFECERLSRDVIGFDINEEMIAYVSDQMQGVESVNYCVSNCDVTDEKNFDIAMKQNLAHLQRNSVDFVIAHPPYMDIVKFTDNPCDLSMLTDIGAFKEKFVSAMRNVLKYLSVNRYFAIVIGDVYKHSEVIPLGFELMEAIRSNFKVMLKGIIVKDINGNRGKIGAQNIWRYRALRSDYYIFKHEYILVFKKVRP